MPYLNLDLLPDEPDAEPPRLALAPLEAVMLFPADPEKRAATIRAAFAEDIVEASTSRARDNPNSGAQLDNSDAAIVLRYLRDAPRPSDLQKDAKHAFVHGFATGALLCEAIARDRCGAGTTLDLIMDDVVGMLHHRRVGGALLRISKPTLRNSWRAFRPVRHLWAAFWMTAGSDGLFPCHQKDLRHFLAVAEQFRLLGEATTPKGSDTPLLDPTSTWRPSPQALAALPAVQLTWAKNP